MPANAPTWQEFVASWELFRDPVWCAVIGGAALGFLGLYVVLRRMVFVSAAITQSAALGVALAFFSEIHLDFHVDPVIGAALLALFTTVVLLPEPRRVRLTHDAILGMAFALSGGLAIWVGDRIAQEAHDIQAILFGTAVLVRPIDLHVVEGCAAIIAAVHLWWFRGLTFTMFERDAARVQGLPVGLLTGVVFVSIGVMVGVTARALGAMPVFALTTLPAIAVLALGFGGLRTSFLLAAVVGAAAGVGGYLFAFFRELPVGASQTVLAGAFALLCVGGRWMVSVVRGRR